MNSSRPNMSEKLILVVWSYHIVIWSYYIVTPLQCFFFISIYQSMKFIYGGDY